MQEPLSDAVRPSSIAEFARHLDPKVCTALRLDDALITGAELLVSVCRALTDSESPLPWQDRLEKVMEAMDLQQLEIGIESIVGQFRTPEEAKTWANSVQRVNYQLFACRLLGAAEYRRFVSAVREDGAVVALAARRALRALMPFAVAWSDAVSSMSQDQRKAVSKREILALDLVRGIAVVDKALGEKILKDLPMELTVATCEDLTGWEPEDLREIVSSLRDRVAEASAERLQRENSQLVRKVRGARDALKYSEDGVSQAANSLIELIDRIMREAFRPKDVLAWIKANLPDEPLLTYIKDGKEAPTKRGEALCFVYSASSVAREANEYDDGAGPALIQDVLARILVSTRDKLQKLKHSDGGTQEERERLLALFSALEGALLLGLIVRNSAPATNQSAAA
ncbi:MULTISPECIES: hypothetical protein [unclassified Streptomyces]|uniref:hypothetical protein n=1 Tax=unclassified Streptomyces TaxID=2593676 RepID=UPI00224F1E9B|nr:MULTISPECIES: hypothetical protein [unclassified Streptomyces]MCX5063790.1 hypothetical protein [Streptomyces sp. NBC_00452]MCX5294152.1 hypothetical protein [Streptomyces sp. NBC_00183]